MKLCIIRIGKKKESVDVDQEIERFFLFGYLAKERKGTNSSLNREISISKVPRVALFREIGFGLGN